MSDNFIIIYMTLSVVALFGATLVIHRTSK